MSGRLVLVATPIGNLGDLSPRAADALRDADAVVCEDTRRTRALLSHAGIPGGRRLRAMPAAAEDEQAAWIVERVGAGETVALVTDAGMPGISDPGARAVRACIDAGLDVDVVPGPDAATTALVLSGLPTDRFVMEGFLPRKGRARRERLAQIAAEVRTTVVYEAPRRVLGTIADLVAVCDPDRPAAVARELTKLHQEVVRAPLGGLVEALGGPPAGECVIVVGGAPRATASLDEAVVDAALREELARGASTRDAVMIVSERLGVSRRVVYERAVRLADR